MELMSRNPHKKIILRSLTIADCNENYVNWLNDPVVNQYLETRWQKQSLDSIKAFVSGMQGDTSNYLFAIINKETNKHIGNIKLGPINPKHRYADVSYFIGEQTEWGKGFASEAIHLITDFGFSTLKLNRIQAGLYAGNVGSAKALEKAGFQQEAIFKKQLHSHLGWEDHVWYVKFASE